MSDGEPDAGPIEQPSPVIERLLSCGAPEDRTIGVLPLVLLYGLALLLALVERSTVGLSAFLIPLAIAALRCNARLVAGMTVLILLNTVLLVLLTPGDWRGTGILLLALVCVGGVLHLLRGANQRLRESLYESRWRYRSLFEQSQDAVLLLDLQGNRIEVNQRTGELLGYGPGAAMDTTYRKTVVPEQHSDSKRIIESLLRGEKVPLYERTFRNREGKLVYTEINAELVRDEQGRPRHIQSIVRDISDRKLAEERKLALRLEEERRRLLLTFLRNAAHEFRTPLTVINSGVYLMAHHADADLRQSKTEQVQAQVSQLTRLVDMLLLMAELDDPDQVKKKPVNLTDLLRTICDQMVREHGPQPALSLELPPDLPPVQGSAAYLGDALRQLLHNAYRFSPPDGAITVRAGQDSADFAWLSISDTGPGIPDDALPHIFETFWRQDKARTSRGFGLGLPIAQRVAQAHGGSVSVETTPGEGTTFTLTLPLTEQVTGTR